MEKEKIKVSFPSGNVVEVDVSTSLSDMQSLCPNFFKTPHGKRETYHPYRGCLIVRNTVTFTGCRPSRRTTVYLFTKDLEGSPDFFCISTGSELGSIRAGEKLIDLMLATGQYSYNMEHCNT